MPAKRIAIVAFPGLQALDATGPFEVFAAAARYAPGSYEPVIVAAQETVESSSGLSLRRHAGLDALRGPLDTLLVAGGDGTRAATRDAQLVEAIAEAAPRARRIASVCTGAFLLAQAGLLDGRRATTHWAACREFRARYPRVELDDDPIWVRDGNVYTSAGVTAGMDLALALVEEDLGRDAALTIARYFVLFLRRPANQSQFSAQLRGQLAERDSLRALQQWIVENPGAELSVEALAARVAMSPRHFARAFKHEVGVTPGRYVEQVRVEAARRRLEDTAEPVAAIATACGFGTPETMRRSFIRALNTSPAEYRRRFAA